MSDKFFDDFAAAMRDKQEQMQAEGPRVDADDELAERTVLRYMAKYPLKSGQMLLVGPEAVRTLSMPGGGPVAVGVYVLEWEHWACRD